MKREWFLLLLVACVTLIPIGCFTSKINPPDPNPKLKNELPLFTEGITGSQLSRTVNPDPCDYRWFNIIPGFCKDYNDWVINVANPLAETLKALPLEQTTVPLIGSRTGTVSFNGDVTDPVYTRKVVLTETDVEGAHNSVVFMTNDEGTKWDLIMRNPQNCSATDAGRLIVYEVRYRYYGDDSLTTLMMYNTNSFFDEAYCLIDIRETLSTKKAKILLGSVDDQLDRVTLHLFLSVTDKTTINNNMTARLFHKDFLPIDSCPNYLDFMEELPDSPGLINDVDHLKYYAMTDPNAPEYDGYPPLVSLDFSGVGANAEMFLTLHIDSDLNSNLDAVYHITE
ncbi:MAG: hypothetical protein ACM3ZC_13550 [Bacteroidota bacterium]